MAHYQHPPIKFSLRSATCPLPPDQMWPTLATLVASSCLGHGDPKLFPINPQLGVSGFPDCHRIHPERHLSMVDASFDLTCTSYVIDLVMAVDRCQ
jgi:hypothetical protein